MEHGLPSSAKTKTLVIKQDGNSFERYINSEMKSDACTVESYSYISRYFQKKGLMFIIDFIKNFLSGTLHRKVKEFDTIIIFESRLLILLMFFVKRRDTKLILWQWNISDCKYAQKVNRMKRFCEIWTFDSNDAKKYGWNLNTQFYCPKKDVQQMPAYKTKNSALFVGVDKGRLQQLIEIEEKLKVFGIKCDFYIKPDNTTMEKEKSSITFINKYIEYENYLEMIKDAGVLIELVQNGQSGSTFRALEAAFYNKKLLTNNKRIRQERFYDPNHIFIIGYDSWERFEDFIKSPMQPTPSNILEEYTAKQWIENFNRVTESC